MNLQGGAELGLGEPGVVEGWFFADVVVGIDFGDGAFGNINTITSRVPIDQVSDSKRIRTLNHILKVDLGTEEGVGVFFDDIKVALPAYDVAEGAAVDEFIGQGLLKKGDVLEPKSLEPVINDSTIHHQPPI